jgi:DNA adenine methylase
MPTAPRGTWHLELDLSQNVRDVPGRGEGEGRDVSAIPAESKVMRPILRWHGGKFRLAPWIQSFFPKHRIYCEPFSGAGSVLLTKPRVWAEYLNDLDGQVINLFRVLQDGSRAKELIRLLTLTPFAREEFDLACGPEGEIDSVERARRLCIRSFMGFSSGSATGKSTGFRSRSFRSNTGPARDFLAYPEKLWAVVNRLRGVTIENRPALEIIPLLDTPGTLIYADPPYPASTRTNYGTYRHELTDDDHVALAECLHGCSGYVLISGYRCDLYDQLYAGWIRVEKQAMSDHGYRQECLWLSPRTAAVTQKTKQLMLLGGPND